MTSKRHDYADNEEVLGNFKRVGLILKTIRIGEVLDRNPAFGAALFYNIIKMDRLANLTIGKKTPKNESKRDTWRDFLNYLFLAYATDIEGESG